MDTKTKKTVARSLLQAADALEKLQKPTAKVVKANKPDHGVALALVKAMEENLDQIRSSLLALEKNPDKMLPQVENITAALHNIKGFSLRLNKTVQPLVDKLKSVSGKAKKMKADVESEEAQQVADTIVKQMGGMGRLKMMIGAKHFAFTKEKSGGAVFQFPSPHKGPNAVKILLTPADTYEVTFLRGSKVVDTLDDIYAEDLKRIFEEKTGLYLSL